MAAAQAPVVAYPGHQTIGRGMAHRHEPSQARGARRTGVIAALAGVTLASTSVAALVAASPAAAAGPFVVPGVIDAITQPLSNGDMWVLTNIGRQEAMYQVNIKSHRTVGAEQVSDKADDIALSANGNTVAVGTTAGAFPAEVWYSGISGRYTASAKSSAPVYRVAVNAAGNSIFALRGTTTRQQVFAVGTANRLGLPYPLPVSAVDFVLDPATKGMLILQPSGTVGHLAFDGGVYSNLFTSGAPARSLVLSPDGTTLYVLRAESDVATSDTIAVVNVAQGTVTKVLNVDSYCAGISLSPDGHTLYEALRGSKSTIKAVPVP
jgi:DNA-binding beta-propeller fold protein YncE